MPTPDQREPRADAPGGVTRLLERWRQGDADAAERLLETTYAELKRIARAHFRHERAGHTLQATALVNEACLRLIPQGPASLDSRESFFRFVSSEMRRRLVDHARRRLAAKRGSGAVHRSIDTALPIASMEPDEAPARMLDRLDRALEKLAAQHPRTALVVQCRFIAGLTNEETAEQLELSVGTVKREWTFAKAWLAAALDGEEA